MRKPNSLCFHPVMAAVILAVTGSVFFAGGQTPPPTQPETAAQAAVKLKGKWVKAFTDARHDFLNNNDRETAEFVGAILDSLEPPEGLSPAAITAQAASLKARVRLLVQRGALESAATLNWAEWRVLDAPGSGEAGPEHPNHKTGGMPGPGGLVLYLPFDAPEEDGVVRDASGAGNDGRVYGATWVANGRWGGAYHFSITNLDDRIQIPNSDLLNPDQITLTAWIKTDISDRFYTRIIDKDYHRGYDLNLSGDVDGRSQHGRFTFEDNDMGLENDRPVEDLRWHHLAGTYDGQINRIYVDGVLQKEKKATRPGSLTKTQWDLCIGNSVVDHGTGEFLAYDGLIDEVRIYNRALSADEIKALASATRAGVEIPQPSANNGGKADAAGRLKQVKALFDQGLINQEDYDKKVKEIMDSL